MSLMNKNFGKPEKKNQYQKEEDLHDGRYFLFLMPCIGKEIPAEAFYILKHF